MELLSRKLKRVYYLVGAVFAGLAVYLLVETHFSEQLKSEKAQENAEVQKGEGMSHDRLEVMQDKNCLQFLSKIDFVCNNTFGNKALIEQLLQAHTSESISVQMRDMNGVTVNALSDSDSCQQITDSPVDGEHYIDVTNIHLSKGLQYLTVEAKASKAELYVYLIGAKSSILIPWLNSPHISRGWDVFGDSTSLKPIFWQTETSPEFEALRIVIDSPREQSIQIRLQHGLAGATIYKGSEENSSTICDVQLGTIINEDGVKASS